MTQDRRTIILRILDDQNRLTERADAKAIALLSTLGIFTIFFVAHFHSIPIDVFSIILMVIYFVSVLTGILHIVMAINPRMRSVVRGKSKDFNETMSNLPTFFGGIARFPSASDYNKHLESMFQDTEIITDTYVHQIWDVAKINETKYKFVRRAVWLVVTALSSQIVLIAYTFGSQAGS